MLEVLVKHQLIHTQLYCIILYQCNMIKAAIYQIVYGCTSTSYKFVDCWVLMRVVTVSLQYLYHLIIRPTHAHTHAHTHTCTHTRTHTRTHTHTHSYLYLLCSTLRRSWSNLTVHTGYRVLEQYNNNGYQL